MTACDTHDLASWIDAEAWPQIALSLVDSRSVSDVALRRLALNLDALRCRDGRLYRRAFDALPEMPIDPMRAANSDARILEAFDALREARATGAAVCVLAVGDGSVVAALAKFGPVLAFDRQQEINVVEPDTARFAATLWRADLRRALGDPRVAWYVGPDWAEAVVDDLLARPTKMQPQFACWGGEACESLRDAFVAIEHRVTSARQGRRDEIDAYYATVSDDEFVAVTSPHPPRKPRVLMLTSAFTSVLKYSTADSADAMHALGWDVMVLTEAERWHAIVPATIEAAIHSFRPDLIFQIDHLRYEWRGSIPERLPFVCWVQDHLTNLTSPEAGPTIGERDFVLTGGVYKYVERHGYPRRQCVDMAKVSREPVVPATWDEDGEDVIYVSNCAQPAASILFETAARLGEIAEPQVQSTYRAAAGEMTRLYAAGKAVRLDGEIREIVRRNAGGTLGVEPEQYVLDLLSQRLNNALYRHQALEWAGHIADARGLRFGIYGAKWDKHPTLARYARGGVDYGEALGALTRRSKILLQLEPYGCFTHQRMLDAVLAGGFTLVRSHPINTLAIRFRDFLARNVAASADTIDDVRCAIAPAASAAFESLVAEMRRFDATSDVVNIIRGWHRGGILGDDAQALPAIDAIEFDSREQLAARIDRFVADRDARRAIAGAQRNAIQQRLTYKAALGRAMRRVHGLLADSLASRVGDAPIREAA